MPQYLYDTDQMHAWEQRWVSQHGDVEGLIKQVAWSFANYLDDQIFKNKQKIAVWCGKGNNAGDGYYTALYLKQKGHDVDIYAVPLHETSHLAPIQRHVQNTLCIYQNFDLLRDYDVHIDALFGLGLNRPLDQTSQQLVEKFNQQKGFKIALDIPTGLNANTGAVMPCAIHADLTLTSIAYKTGLFTGQAKDYIGKLHLTVLIPEDELLIPQAQLAPTQIKRPQRTQTVHKGSNGHVLIVGGHASLGGAVMMAAEAAYATGAGKVTVVCHAQHHQAILARSPNVMVQDIETLTQEAVEELLQQVDTVSFGMGLGRDEWGEHYYDFWLHSFKRCLHLHITLDADALWFLANSNENLSTHYYLTPHSGEAARLLDCTVQTIEQNRYKAIHQLKQKYGGSWVLKGAGSLVLEDTLWVCTAGNAGMATAGMGDVLAGMISGLKGQTEIALHDIVTLHAQAGDLLAQSGQQGIQAYQMPDAIYKVLNAV